MYDYFNKVFLISVTTSNGGMSLASGTQYPTVTVKATNSEVYLSNYCTGKENMRGSQQQSQDSGVMDKEWCPTCLKVTPVLYWGEMKCTELRGRWNLKYFWATRKLPWLCSWKCDKSSTVFTWPLNSPDYAPQNVTNHLFTWPLN